MAEKQTDEDKAAEKQARAIEAGGKGAAKLRQAADLIEHALAGRLSKKDFQSTAPGLVSSAGTDVSTVGSNLPDDPK